MRFKREATTVTCFLAAVAGVGRALSAGPDQHYAQISRINITPVQLPFHQPFRVLRRVPGGKGNIYAQVEWQAQSGFQSVVWEIHPDGRVAATYDLSSAATDTGRLQTFAVDSSGDVFFLTLPSPKGEKADIKASQAELPPVIYVFQQGGSYDRDVTLSKTLQPRQIVVTNSKSFLIAGSATVTSTEGVPRKRQVLYEFKSNGSFIREIQLLPKEKKNQDKSSETESAGPEKFAIIADLSQLLVDAAGNVYLIEPSEAPRIFRVGADGEVAAERRLPKLAGTMVTEAVLDEQGRVVLQRNTMRKPREPRPENWTRVLTVLNGQTLDTVLEALPPADTGGLAGMKGSDFVFLGRHGPLTLEIQTGSLQ